MDGETVSRIILGGLVGLFPIILTSIISWSDKRSITTKQQKALELAKSRVDFIERWVKVQQTINSKEHFEEIKQESVDELTQIKKSLSEILADDNKNTEESEKNLFEQAFLFYRPLNFFSWIAHITYYIVLIITILLVIALQPGIDFTTGDFTWSRVFFIDIPIILVYSIPLLIIRAIAVAIDRNTKEKSN